MLLHSLSAAGEANLLPPKDNASSRTPCSPDIPSFRPLPPLPSASALQLPSFLNFSTPSLTSLADPHPRPSITSLPASALLRSPSPVASSRPVIVYETGNNKVIESPQWIPAFHHPNSPYVPWSSPVRRRILPSPSPFPPSPDCSSSPFIRTGAVAPEPWTSSTFSQAHNKSRKERLLSSWKSFKNSIKKGVKTVISRIGKSRAPLKTICISRDVHSTYDVIDTTTVQPNLTSNVIPSILAKTHNSSGPRDSLASFVSSDSTTLAAWLAERRITASYVINNTAREMSMEEYELMGSWLDLRHCGGSWVCGVQDCEMHSADGSPCAASERPNGLRMAMPFDSADLLSAAHPSPRTPVLFPVGPFSASPRFHSLPRLPCHSFDIHFAQEVRPATLDRAERYLSRGRELSMPDGWTFS